MTTKDNTSSFCLLIVLCALLFMTSCTFDYFEDETNYIVYVPKADRNIRTDEYQIDDLRILIYGDRLEQEKYYTTPFNNNPRSRVGNFNFRLYPGWHSVYCFANTTEFTFSNLDSYDNAKFELPQSEEGHKEPSNVFLCSEFRKPNIQYPSPEIIDTIFFEKKYVGKICIAFKNLTKLNSELNYNNISNIKIEATGVGVYQKLAQFTDSVNTRSSRYNARDRMLLSANKNNNLYEKPYHDYDFGIHNYYLPSLSDDIISEEPTRLSLTFLNNNDKPIYNLYIELVENGNPIVLHTNQTIYIGVDGNKSFTLPQLKLEEWDSNILPTENTGPGGGGIEM